MTTWSPESGRKRKRRRRRDGSTLERMVRIRFEAVVIDWGGARFELSANKHVPLLNHGELTLALASPSPEGSTRCLGRRKGDLCAEKRQVRGRRWLESEPQVKKLTSASILPRPPPFGLRAELVGVATVKADPPGPLRNPFQTIFDLRSSSSSVAYPPTLMPPQSLPASATSRSTSPSFELDELPPPPIR